MPVRDASSPSCAVQTELDTLATDNGFSSAEFEHHTDRWQSARLRHVRSLPVPENMSDETAAALANPDVSAWLSLAFRAKLAPGENVLILGARGVTGKLTVRIAKLLGAGRVLLQEEMKRS
jgi:threonine dehydrogenase-like Zn-dependent dehydrogenase